jgi:hypothetical protein
MTRNTRITDQYNAANMTVRDYETVSDFLSDIALRNLQSDNPTDAGGWRGNATQDEMMSLARSGWSLPRRSVSVLTGSIMSDLRGGLNGKRSIHDVTGSFVDVPAFLAGRPDCMVSRRRRRTAPNGRVVTILVNITVDAVASADEIVKRAAVAASLIESLALLGQSVRLFVELAAANNNKSVSYTVRIKDTNDPLDMDALLAAFHPAFLRHLMFAVMRGDKHNPESFSANYTLAAERLRADFVIDPMTRNDRARLMANPEQYVKDAIASLGLAERD